MMGVSRSGNFFLKSATKFSFGDLVTTCRTPIKLFYYMEPAHSPSRAEPKPLNGARAHLLARKLLRLP